MNRPIENLTFEEALGELEQIVRQLEEGKVLLEDAVKAYERGALLRLHCENKLAQARLRIEKITLSQEDESPQAELVPSLDSSHG